MDAFKRPINNKISPKSILSNGDTITAAPDTVRRMVMEQAGPTTTAIWIELVSHAANFKLYLNTIIKITGCTRYAVTAALKRLRELGLACLHQVRGEGGRLIGSQWTVSNVPLTDKPTTPEADNMTEQQLDIFSEPTPANAPTETPIPPSPANHSPITKMNSLKQTIRKDLVSDKATASDIEKQFNYFYDEYPRKRDKHSALRAFKQRCQGMTNNALDKFTACLVYDVKLRCSMDAQWQRQRAIPYAATYLNHERWRDDIERHQFERIQPERRDIYEELTDRSWAAC